MQEFRLKEYEHRSIYLIVEQILSSTQMQNGEREVLLNSIIVHETQTGYAQAFEVDAHSPMMGKILPEEIVFSQQIVSEWSDMELWEKIKSGDELITPTRV